MNLFDCINRYFVRCFAAGLFLLLGFHLTAQVQIWHKHQSISGGRTEKILHLDSFLFTSIYEQGIFRSDDTAKTWEMPDGAYFWWIADLASKDSMVFAAEYDYFLFRSNDFGRTWDTLELECPVCIHIPNDTIFTGCWDGMFYSIDNGDSWQRSDYGMPDNTHIECITSENGQFFAGCYHTGVYHSNDGINWTGINNNLPDNPTASSIICTNQQLLIYVSHNGIYYSANEGQNWESRNNGLPNHCYTQALHKNDTAIFNCTSIGLFYTTDYGLNWKSLNKNLPEIYIYDLTFVNNEIYASSNGGILHYIEEDDSWKFQSKGIQNANINDICIRGDTIMVATNLGIQYFSNDSCKGKTMFAGLNNAKVTELCNIENMLLARGPYGVLYKTTKLGSSWHNCMSGIENQYITSVCCFNNTFIIAADSGMYRRSLNDSVWKYAGSKPTTSTIHNLEATSSEIFINSDPGIFYSNDYCKTWSRCDTISLGQSKAITISAGSEYIYASNKYDIYKYIIEKDTWKNLHVSPDKDFIFTSIYVDEPNIFALGLYRYGFFCNSFLSMDNGSTFSDISNGKYFWGYNFFPLMINKTSLFVGTNGNSLWKRDDLITETGPETFLPETNIDIYPNPATNKTLLEVFC